LTYIAIGDPVIKRGGAGIPFTSLTPPYLYLSQARIWISKVICHGILCSMSSVKMRGDCLFCHTRLYSLQLSGINYTDFIFHYQVLELCSCQCKQSVVYVYLFQNEDIVQKWGYMYVLNVYHLSSVVKLLHLLSIVNIQHVHVLKWAKLFRKSYFLQWNKNNSLQGNIAKNATTQTIYNTKISIPRNLSLILMKRQIPLILALSEKDGNIHLYYIHGKAFYPE